jgi:hypothetical protein
VTRARVAPAIRGTDFYMTPVALDYETFYSPKLKYSVKTMIAEQYCRHDLFDPYMIAASDGSTCWAGHPKDFYWPAVENKLGLAHNSYFDESVTAEMDRRGMKPGHNPSQWHCTANLTSFLCNRRSLDQAVEHLYGVKLDKSMRSDAKDKRWQDFSETEQKAMLDYARRDAYWCWKLWNDHSHKWPTLERRLSQLTVAQGRRGVQINVDLLDQYICQTHEMKMNTEEQIPWIKDADDEEWEDFKTKPTSTKCIAEQCRRKNIPCPPTKSDDEEGYQLWEDTYHKDHPWIMAVSAWRSINKLYRTFVRVKERLRDDGTLPFGLKYFGAHTGRWSGDAGVNFQNMRKIPVFCNEFGLMEMNEKRCIKAVEHYDEIGQWPEWVRWAIDFRNLVMPRPGTKMIVSDLSQIEPRVLAWLCGDTKMLELLQAGFGPYEAHARASMDWVGGKLKDENKALYALAKARVLALGYGAGWEKFIKMAMTLAGLDITEGDPEFEWIANPRTGVLEQKPGFGKRSREIVKDFRAQNPLISGESGIWKTLDKKFKESVGSDFTMNLPSGRKMIYSRVRCERRVKPNSDTGKPEWEHVYTCDIGGKRTKSYGGKLTENITQAVARDVFGEHLIAMEDNGWTNLFSVHDEAVLEVDESVTAKDVEHAMSKCPDWLKGCPIAAEAKEVEFYCK